MLFSSVVCLDVFVVEDWDVAYLCYWCMCVCVYKFFWCCVSLCVSCVLGMYVCIHVCMCAMVMAGAVLAR